MNLSEVVSARRSVRSFEDRRVPPEVVERAIRLAIQAPAPHHSAPWRFTLIEEPRAKDVFGRAMRDAWRRDLERDGVEPDRVAKILARSAGLLAGAPLLTLCSMDLSRAHSYPDERRRRAEWSLFAHSIGAGLQTYMLALAEEGVASCWISAPVFCGEVIKELLGLPGSVEPQALVLVGYASADYRPRPRDVEDISGYLLPFDSLPDHE